MTQKFESGAHSCSAVLIRQKLWNPPHSNFSYVELILQNVVNGCSAYIHIGIMCCNLVENSGNS